jgi:hypothetical protein
MLSTGSTRLTVLTDTLMSSCAATRGGRQSGSARGGHSWRAFNKRVRAPSILGRAGLWRNEMWHPVRVCWRSCWVCCKGEAHLCVAVRARLVCLEVFLDASFAVCVSFSASVVSTQERERTRGTCQFACVCVCVWCVCVCVCVRC